MKACNNIYQIINKLIDFLNFFYRKKVLTLKDPVKIKNWFIYRNRKMKHIIRQDEMTSSFFNFKPVLTFIPSSNLDIYLNIAKQIYANNVMMILFNALFRNAIIQQANCNGVKQEI